jgi:hypothetical protein
MFHICEVEHTSNKPVVIRFYVDADHAGDHVTRRSRTGFIMFINCALTKWYSKKQGSAEGATFGSEFMVMKTVAEVNKAVRYKLRMMGKPIDGPSYVYGDNMSVLHNTLLGYEDTHHTYLYINIYTIEPEPTSISNIHNYADQ